jgi:rare lipoprotein A
MAPKANPTKLAKHLSKMKEKIHKRLFCSMALSLIIFLACSTTGTSRRANSDIPRSRDKLNENRNEEHLIIGYASYYAEKFHGKKTASGEIFDMNALTAAHRTLPFGTVCRITNLENNKSVVVRVNDRGPFVKDRILDLSKGASAAIGGIEAGIIKVRIDILDKP